VNASRSSREKRSSGRRHVVDESPTPRTEGARPGPRPPRDDDGSAFFGGTRTPIVDGGCAVVVVVVVVVVVAAAADSFAAAPSASSETDEAAGEDAVVSAAVAVVGVGVATLESPPLEDASIAADAVPVADAAATRGAPLVRSAIVASAIIVVIIPNPRRPLLAARSRRRRRGGGGSPIPAAARVLGSWIRARESRAVPSKTRAAPSRCARATGDSRFRSRRTRIATREKLLPPVA
jgi:hypothetical protein